MQATTEIISYFAASFKFYSNTKKIFEKKLLETLKFIAKLVKGDLSQFPSNYVILKMRKNEQSVLTCIFTKQEINE